MHGIANSEFNEGVSRGIRRDRSHDTSHVDLGPRGKSCVLFNETFEVHTVAINAGFYEWELWKSFAFLVLSAPDIHPE